MKYIIRIIVLPIIFLIYLYPVLRLFYISLRDFIKHGGEFITYHDKNEVESIKQMYYSLKKLHKQGEEDLI